MDSIESHESDRAVGRAVVPSSEDTVTLPPTQPPYRKQWVTPERLNRRDDLYAFLRRAQAQNRYVLGVREAVGL